MNRYQKTAITAHRVLGLFAALHMLVLIITGSVLIFRAEIEGVPSSTQEDPILSHSHIEHSHQLGQQMHPEGRPLAMFLDEDIPRPIPLLPLS